MSMSKGKRAGLVRAQAEHLARVQAPESAIRKCEERAEALEQTEQCRYLIKESPEPAPNPAGRSGKPGKIKI
jgi:hypothetical protein